MRDPIVLVQRQDSVLTFRRAPAFAQCLVDLVLEDGRAVRLVLDVESAVRLARETDEGPPPGLALPRLPTLRERIRRLLRG